MKIYNDCPCYLLADQPEVRKKQRPPVKPEPKSAAAAAAVEPFSSASFSLSSLLSAVTDVAAGKLVCTTRARRLYSV